MRKCEIGIEGDTKQALTVFEEKVRERGGGVHDTDPPDAKVIPTGGQQVWVDALGVWDPHDLGGGVRMIKRVSAHKLAALLIQTHKLHLHTRAHTHTQRTRNNLLKPSQ